MHWSRTLTSNLNLTLLSTVEFSANYSFESTLASIVTGTEVEVMMEPPLTRGTLVQPAYTRTLGRRLGAFGKSWYAIPVTAGNELLVPASITSPPSVTQTGAGGGNGNITVTGNGPESTSSTGGVMGVRVGLAGGAVGFAGFLGGMLFM